MDHYKIFETHSHSIVIIISNTEGTINGRNIWKTEKILKFVP